MNRIAYNEILTRLCQLERTLNGGKGSGNHNPGQGRGVGKPANGSRKGGASAKQRQQWKDDIKGNKYIGGEKYLEAMDLDNMDDNELEIFSRIAKYEPVSHEELMSLKRVKEAEDYLENNPRLVPEEHPELVDKVAQEFKEKILADAEARGGAKKEHKLLMVAGLPGAGKSSTGLDEKLNSGYIEFDNDIAKQVPSLAKYYDGGKGAGVVQDIVSAAQEKLGAELRKEGYNIAYPAIGKKFEKVSRELTQYRQAGYDTSNPESVQYHYVDIEPSTAKVRAVTRYYQTGRYVSPNYINDVGTRPRETVAKIKSDGYLDGELGYVKVAVKEKDNNK